MRCTSSPWPHQKQAVTTASSPIVPRLYPPSTFLVPHSLPPPPFLLSLSVFSSREDLVGALHQLAIAAAKGRGGRCRSELSQTMDAVHDAVELDLAHNKKGARTQIVNAIATIKVRTGGVEGGGH